MNLWWAIVFVAGWVLGFANAHARLWLVKRNALRREARARCQWCGRLRPHKPGQACDVCLKDLSTLRNGQGGYTAAAPADWPKA